MTGTFPAFEDFYAAVNGGREPFPWQRCLAERVAGEGWPEEIGIPTGLGKTACIDIAVWALASQAARLPRERTLPTRIWYVVNRRLLVDAAFDHGRNLAQALNGMVDGTLSSSQEEALDSVAGALRSISGFGSESDPTLVVSRVRGGADLGERPPHPSQPALTFATVPMFASSWLFRGYASSVSMRPVDAAHAGVDSLVLLDEAHLSRPLMDLAEPVRLCDVGNPESIVGPHRCRPVFVAMTATGESDDPFTLTEDDESHPVERMRLDAPKLTELVEVQKKANDLAKPLADKTVELVSQRPAPPAAVVFANTPAQARSVFDHLAKEAKKRRSALVDADIVLLTGRMRRREAELARGLILDPVRGAPSSRDRSVSRSKPLVVVSTQTLEVGADLDFDVLVTETCGTRSLIQRLGRCNRLGAVSDAQVAIVHSAKSREWPVYGTEPGEVWRRLVAADDFGAPLDLSPALVGSILGPPSDEPPRVAELLPAHLWEWAKTSSAPPGEAPLEPFFAGIEDAGARVSICWRATRFADGDQVVPSVSGDESIELPLYEARDAITSALVTDASVARLARDRVSAELVGPNRLAPGDVVVLNVSDGLYDEHGWAPESRDPVIDVSIPRWPGIPIDPATLGAWLDASEGSVALVSACADLADAEDPFADRDRLDRLWAALPGAVPEPACAVDWSEAVAEANEELVAFGHRLLLKRRNTGARFRGSVLLAADAFDDLSAPTAEVDGPDASSVLLEQHCASVGAIAATLARAIGLSPEVSAAVEAAGRFHDLGKSDPRFQRWLDPSAVSEDLLAKSTGSRLRWRAARTASGWPAGGRHEALSARLVQSWLDESGDPDWDSDLVIHLVLSHHGYGRPLVRPVADEEPTEVTHQVEGRTVTVSGNLGECDWGQPARFRRCCERYGYWGLAMAEAVVRQSDHLASSRIGRVVVA